MEQNSKKSFLINLSYTAAIGLIVFFALRLLLKYLFPFVFALIIAGAVQKPARFISSKVKIKRSVLAAVLAIAFYIAAAFIFGFSIYRLAVSSRGLLEDLPSLFEALLSLVSKVQKSLSSLFSSISPDLSRQLSMMVSDMIDNFRSGLTSFFSSFAASVASKTPTFLLSGLVALVASCYIAKDYEGLARFLRELIGKRIYGNILKVKAILSGSILKLGKSYLILTFITFIELFIGFLILKVKYAFPLALIISFIDLLPVFGTGTVLVPWGIISIISGDNTQGFGILILYLIITIVRNFLEPKIIGSQIGINPLFTLVAMFAGLKLFGFWGLIIFPVSLIVIVKYYKNEMEEEMAENNLSHNM